MVNNQSNQLYAFSLLLPQQEPNSRVKPGPAGDWDSQGYDAFEDIANSLALPNTNKETVSISSVPDMWARPLFVGMVLRNHNHPLHPQIKAEWKGMLAAIALAEAQGLKLRAVSIDLESEKYQGNELINSLLELTPKQGEIYQLESGKNPWKHIYVFLLNDNAVGMTSPSTLVFPAEDANWRGVPWVDNNRLCSPVFPVNYLTEVQKVQLWHWLKDLGVELQKDGKPAATKITEIIAEFQTELKESLGDDPKLKKPPTRSEQYFEVSMTPNALAALEAIKPNPMPSSMQVRTCAVEVLVLPEREELESQWPKKQPQDIWIYETTNLLNYDKNEFIAKYKDKDKCKYLTLEDIFLEKLYFIKGTEMLPGALLPKGIETLTYEDRGTEEKFTPLLPIKSELLEYFTSDQLNSLIELKNINLGAESGLRISLKLPLVGGDYIVTKEYKVTEVNRLNETIPFLEVWPEFQAKGWQEYYAFYCDDIGDKTFHVSFPNTEETRPVPIKNFQITRLKKFPPFIICWDKTQSENLGLILLKSPREVGDQDPEKTWVVGVDFGTSFTNVYYKSNKQSKRLSLSPMHLQVTNSDNDFRTLRLYEYFMQADKLDFPVSTVLTTRGNQGRERLIFDGRRYNPPKNLKEFDTDNNDYYKTDLKWELNNLDYNRLFLKHLALMITVEAAKNDVRRIEWTVSFPSAFSVTDNGHYSLTWEDIIEELKDKTGIEQQWLPEKKGEYYRSESIALAQYFAEEEEQDLVYTTCIDMGGGSSDVSIWQGNHLVHECSLQLAGRLLFCDFIQNKTQFIKEQFTFELESPTVPAQKQAFYVKLDALLNVKSQKWLKDKRPRLAENPDLQDIIQGTTIGIAGIYYYVGIIIKGLHEEGRLDREEITKIYIGGNGSQIFHWLSDSGKFDNNCKVDKLFRQMLSKGSGFPDKAKEPTRLSSQPKAEVACGLVANQKETRLKGLDYNEDEDNKIVFSGEECCVNGDKDNLFGAYSRLKLPDKINKIEVRELSHLKSFFEDFHQSLKELKIPSIKPLAEYKDKGSSDFDAFWKRVETKFEEELYKMNGDIEEIRVEPPFILGLKSLLRVLGER